MLRILHLSDLHWAPMYSADLNIVVNALIDDLKRLQEEKGQKIDLVVFSGDLALGGDDLNWFQGGYDALLVPVAQALNLTFDRVFVAPGNHDIAREQVRRNRLIEKSLKEELVLASSINRFMDQNYSEGDEKFTALKRMENFFDAHDSYHQTAISSSPFLRTYSVNINECQVGVACFNTAWRATGEADDVDYGNLILGERAIDQALIDLEKCDFRIAVHHHPLDWLVNADRESTDFLTRKSFNLSCCGHVHASRPSMSLDAAGTCILSQTGSVFAGREWFNGYQIIEVDLPSRSYTFHVREYHNNHRRFSAATRVSDDGTVKFENIDQGNSRREDQIELLLRSNRTAVRDMIADQLNFFSQAELKPDAVIRQFVAPPLVERTLPSLDKESDQPKNQPKASMDRILSSESNTLIIGQRHSGKTSIAHYLVHRLATEKWANPSIPIYIDARTFKFNRYAIRRCLTTMYDSMPAGFNPEKAVADGLITIVIDNITSCENQLRELRKCIDANNKCKWICVATPNIDGISPDRLFNDILPDLEKYHIQEFNRGSIRTLSKRWYSDGLENGADAYTIVMNQINRDGLPKTPYMVALLLWALRQSKELTKINEAILLGNIVDHLLGKADFRLAKRGALHPIGKEITLQNLARYMKDKGGVAPENEVVSFLIEFFDRKKLSFFGGDVLDKLVDCGILKRDIDIVSFKYQCFQDYFYAQLLRNDNKLLAKSISGLEFLQVRREIEILSGIRQQNDDIITSILETIDSRVPQRFTERSINDFDNIARSRIKIGTTKAELGKIRRSRLTDDQVDEMMDEADRRAMGRGDRKVSESLERADGDLVRAGKEREADAISMDREVDNGPIRPVTHMAAIDTLARVIRNSDFTDYDVKGPAARHVFQSWVKIFLLVLEELQAVLKVVGEKSGDPLSSEEYDAIVYIMSKFIFNAVGQSIINQISSPAMTDTILEIMKSESVSAGEKMILLFLIEDMNVPGWQDSWCAVIRDKNSSNFMVESIVERLQHICATKALNDDQSRRVSTVVDEIENRLDWSNDNKVSMVQTIRSAVAMASVKEGLMTNQ